MLYGMVRAETSCAHRAMPIGVVGGGFCTRGPDPGGSDAAI